ncbi:MAG: transporter substrate-binding domain-containing protein [Candidatus Competibacteraceae bacterium]
MSGSSLSPCPIRRPAWWRTGLAPWIRRLTRIYLLVTLAVTGPAAAAPTVRSIIIGSRDNIPPYAFINEQGHPDGFNINLLRTLGEVMGWQVQFRLGPRAQMQQDLEAGRIDALLLLDTAERRETFLFSNALTLIHFQAFARRDTPTIQQFQELRNREAIILRGGFLHDYLQRLDPDIQLIPVDHEADALRLLAAGEHDYAVVSELGGRWAQQHYHLSNLVAASPPLAPRGYALAVRREHSELREQINQGLAILTETGRYDSLYNHWLGEVLQDPHGLAAMLSYTVWVLTPLTVIAIAALFWSWLLRRQVAQRTRQLQWELSERQQAEAALRESEARFRDVTEAASDWIWEMDENLCFTYLSERFYALTGIAPHHVIGRARWELSTVESAADQQKWQQHREMLEKHLPFRDFIYHTTRRLSDRHLKISGKPIYTAQGKFAGYRGTGTDITEQVKAATALHDSELLLRQIIDLVPHMIFAKDRHGHFLLANRATAEAYGVTVDDLVNRSHRAIHLVDEEIEQMLADDREVIDSGVSKLIAEESFTDHTGRVRIMQTIKIPLVEPSFNEPAALGVSFDITEQKHAKEEVARMRLYLKNIIDSMPSILIGVDPWGYITVLNQPAEQSSGVSWEAAQGRYFGEVFPQLEQQFEQIRQAIRFGRPIKTPRMMLEVDGAPRYADIMVYPLITDGASGAVIRWDDVTARVRIESMMVQTEKMLSVGGLAAGMAHEINNPLGAILQGSQNILRRISPDMPQNRAVAAAIGVDLDQINRYLEQRRILHFLEGIREAGTRAAKIVTDMLSFSRRSESQFGPVDLEDMLETVLRLAASDYDLKKSFDFKHITIERDYDATLRVVYCDKTEIEQVILNLLKNSAQAMTEDGTFSPTITVRTRQEKNFALIEVIDNGPGMDEKTLKRIFEPFFTTKEVGAGTGLGLSVSYFIVTEQHNGRLSVTSKPGQGACFSIRLPFTREALT